MTSLRTLLALQPRVLYPAHGPHIPSQEGSISHIQTYIAHRQKREDEIVATLKRFSLSLNVEDGGENIAEALITLKKEIHENKEAENKAKGRSMLDTQKAVPLPDFEDEKKALEKIDASKGVSMSVIARILYKSEDERLLFAAAKNVNAHLDKLIKDGKVRKGRVRMCKLVGSEVGEVEEMDGWEWIGEKEKPN